MPNQFTKARDEGRPAPQASNAYLKGTRTRMDPRQKAQIQATQLLNRLHKFALGKTIRGEKINMDTSQVAAARAVIDKGLPSLQAIEHKDADPLQDMSLDEQIDMAKALILSHPEIMQALNLTPSPVVVQQLGDMPEVTTNMQVIESIKAA
jgi:hypothetical protein